MTHICIIGAGVSGLLLVLLLAETSIELNSVTIVDPYFDGGDLMRKWANVMSNTPWSVTLTNIEKYLPSVKIPKWALELPSDKPTPVSTIVKLIRECAKPVLEKVNRVHGMVESANWNSSKSGWSIVIRKEQTIATVESKSICFTYGSKPKELDISVPCIPLEVALDPKRLSLYVDSNQKVVVFGTRHSGVYVLKNLIDASVKSIIGVYNGSTPFVWARDGAYDGIKLEAALIADEIIESKHPEVQLCPMSSFSTILREVRTADWVVYAIGFEPCHNIKVSIDDAPIIQNFEYDSTGKLLHCPCAWGFGIAYPSQAPDGIHWDVGVSSFLEHIHRQIPSIISIIYPLQ
jgi:hypothetical protein